MTTETDEDRWAEAQSLLDRTPSESAQQRVKRWRRLLILLIAALVVLGVALGVAVLAWADDSHRGSDDGPLWREIAGLVVSFLAIVVILWGVVVQWRGNRRRMAWRSPLVALTRGQRKELWAQVRDGGPVPPERLPLARHLAETLAGQGILVVIYLGILLQWTGQFISSPSGWRLVLVVVTAAVTAVSMPLVLRNVRRGRSFLDAHPAPEE